MCRLRLVTSSPLTIEPSTATPATAPSSRLVLTAEAAIPDRAAGTTPSTEDVTATMTTPSPAPTKTRDQPNSPTPELAFSRALVTRIPTPAHTQPAAIGMPGPARATQRPLNADARIMTAAIGRKSRAMSYGDAVPISCTYRGMKKNTAKVAKYPVKATRLPPRKARSRKNRRSSTGSSARRSTKTKARAHPNAPAKSSPIHQVA